jgi:glucoamylase
MKKHQILFIFLLGFGLTAFAGKLDSSGWMTNQEQISIAELLRNISPAGTKPGVVVASPQKENPNYFRHWVRDAGLVFDVVMTLLEAEAHPKKRTEYEKHIKDFIYFSRQNQLSYTLTDLGEPIFEVDGTPFSGPWGRPQNDGPAIRAYMLTRYANWLLDQGKEEFVKTWLYSARLPANTVIKADLEYISHKWRNANFDLWEETKGDHFYTHMVQRRALFEGARLALRLNDEWAADWYSKQASEIEKELEKYWSTRKKQINSTRNRVDGVDYKHSNLDMAVILGVLHGEQDRTFSIKDQRVAETFTKLVEVFKKIYPINNQKKFPGVALGRYPEDKYAGTNFNGGNPWVLTTLAAAEYLYKVASLADGNDSNIAEELIREGDQFVYRVKSHIHADGSMAEQIDKNTGFMVSAQDLTWSYAAFITAKKARDEALRRIK